MNIPQFIIDWYAKNLKRPDWSISDADEMDIYELTVLLHFYEYIGTEPKE